VIKTVAKQMGIAESGYRRMINTGEDGGQTVPHLHIHILGGTKLPE
ncbi:MAG: HIT domain-containing protein, partial [Christensenellaceae bacterium]